MGAACSNEESRTQKEPEAIEAQPATPASTVEEKIPEAQDPAEPTKEEPPPEEPTEEEPPTEEPPTEEPKAVAQQSPPPKALKSRSVMDAFTALSKDVIEDDDAASHFVRLEKTDSSRELVPRRLIVLSGEKVQFSWKAEKSPEFRRIVEADNKFQPKAEGWEAIDKDGDRCCVHHFELPPGKGCGSAVSVQRAMSETFPDAKCTFLVVSPKFYGFLRLFRRILVSLIMVAIVVIAAFVTVRIVSNSQFVDSLVDCGGQAAYCGTLEELKGYIVNRAAVPIALGTLILLLFFPALLISYLWPRPRLDSFGRGWDIQTVRSVRILCMAFLLVPLICFVFNWSANILFTRGLTEVLHTLQRFMQGIVDDLLTTLLAVKDLMGVARSFGGGAALSQTQLDQILGYEEMARTYVQLGTELMVVLVNVRLCLTFWGLILGVLAFAYGFAGIIRRSSSRLRTSYWIAFLALFVMFYSQGVNSLMLSLWRDTVHQYVDDEGNLQMPKDGQSMALSLLSMCEKDGGGGQLPYKEIVQPFSSFLDSFGKKTSKKGHSLSFKTPPSDPSGFSIYVGEIRSDLSTLSRLLGQPEANMEELGLEGMSKEELQKAMVAGTDILGVVRSFLACEQIKPFLQELMTVLDQQVVPAISALVSMDIAQVVVILVWVILAEVAAHMFDRPRKFWYDPISRRWFRFRISFIVARRLREKSTGKRWFAHRVPRRCCSALDWFHGILMLDTVLMAFLVGTGLMLLVWERDSNPTADWVIAGSSLLLVSTAVGMAGSWNKLWLLRNRVLRFLGVLFVVASLACYSYSTWDNWVRLSGCLDKVSGGLLKGPLPSTTVSCETSDCTVEVAGNSLQDGHRLLALPSSQGCDEAGASSLKAGDRFLSEKATGFGRRYYFPGEDGLPDGVYSLCWGSTGRKDLSKYTHFSGLLHVNREIDRFSTCNLEVMSGFSQATYYCLSIMPFQVARIILGLLTLLKAVYSTHITDRMRSATRSANQKAMGNKVAEVDQARNRSSVGAWIKMHLRLYWMHFLVVLIALICITVLFLVNLGQGEWMCYFDNSCPSDSEVVTPSPVPAARQSCPTCCNLQEAVCGKPFDEVAFATAHNAMSNKLVGDWLFPNNLLPLDAALAAGVRALMLDVYYFWPTNATDDEKKRPTDVHLCHGFCTVGHELLSDTLLTVKGFLDSNPRDVVVLMFEQYVATSSVIEVLNSTNLTFYTRYGHPGPQTPWPTMEELISNNSRLIVTSNRERTFRGFRSSGRGIKKKHLPDNWQSTVAVPWWHVWDETRIETSFAYTDPEAMEADCEFKWGVPENFTLDNISQQDPVGSYAHALTVTNHFISDPLPNEQAAKQVNRLESLQGRMDHCRSLWKHQANFLAVDFWSLGDVVDAALYLNEQSF